MQRIAISGLCQIDLPGYTLRLSDGGVITWSGNTFYPRDATYGAIGSVDAMTEGEGDELSPLEMTLLPPSDTAAANLVQPLFQGSRVRFWIAEFTLATGAVSGSPDLYFDGELDQATLEMADFSLSLSIIPRAGRLFETNTGNNLSPSFHKSVWSGETGHDNATGLGRVVAWGAVTPPQPVVQTSSPNLPFPGLPPGIG